MLLGLARHPGHVLDVVELGDLRGKERVAAARYSSFSANSWQHQQQQQHRGLIATRCCFAQQVNNDTATQKCG